MITVSVAREDQRIRRITIEGHANAGPYGSDIVCSAVSAVSFGVLNAVHALLGVVPEVEQDSENQGFLGWTLSPMADAQQDEKLQLLAESLIVSLAGIAQSYDRFIQVRDSRWQGGA